MARIPLCRPGGHTEDAWPCQGARNAGCALVSAPVFPLGFPLFRRDNNPQQHSGCWTPALRTWWEESDQIASQSQRDGTGFFRLFRWAGISNRQPHRATGSGHCRQSPHQPELSQQFRTPLQNLSSTIPPAEINTLPLPANPPSAARHVPGHPPPSTLQMAGPAPAPVLP